MKQSILFLISLLNVSLAYSNGKFFSEIEPTTKLQLHPERNESFAVSVPVKGMVEIFFKSDFSTQQGTENIRVHLKCNSEAILIQGRHQKNFFEGDILIFNADKNKQATLLDLQTAENKCQIKYFSNTYSILPEAQIHKSMSDLRKTEKLSAIENGSMNARVLKDPYHSLSARFKALFGRDLTEKEYLDKDPNMTIDLLQAPSLDLIVLNTLQITNDFVGRIMMRGLEHHANRGSKIYFMTTRNLIFQKDFQMIEDFKMKFPGASVEMYEKITDKISFSQAFANMHRTNHVKVMLTYSEEQPENNSFIAGGRNLSELYFYKQMPDNQKYDDIVQWNVDHGYGWVYFDDLDFEIKNNVQFKNMAMSLVNFNERQYSVNKLNRIDLNQNGSHIYSYPFGDTKDILEQDYLNILNSAKESIFIISPYLNMTTKIKEALDHAKNAVLIFRYIRI